MKQGVPGAILLLLVSFGLIFTPTRLPAFSLLGPYEEWMQPSDSFRSPVRLDAPAPGDIGGPMVISNGYRWNVPVVTYGFDPSFISFFGTNGVAAVEAAIQILNDLPPASKIQMTNFPEITQGINSLAASRSLYDLKSAALQALLEQLGLTSPTRFEDVIYLWVAVPGGPFYEEYAFVQRNYDPQTLASSRSIDGFLFTYQVISLLPLGENIRWAEPAMEGPQPPYEPYYPAVADNVLAAGEVYNGLTQDDVGGLSYLLSTKNVAYETLLPGISGVGSNSSTFVNGAWRPGVDKVTFVPHALSSVSGAFLPMTNQFTDTYVTNNTVAHQQLQRVTTQPDFLFCAGDTYDGILAVLPYSRTGTSNWINNASLNSNPSGGGPGVIPPPVRITFAKLGRQFGSDATLTENSVEDSSTFWGTFDLSTNPPIVYPATQTGTNFLTVRLQLGSGSSYYSIPTPRYTLTWTVSSQAGAMLLLQTSTNLTDWITLSTVQNDGSICTLSDLDPSSAQRYYRVAPMTNAPPLHQGIVSQ
ncbi:MAG: hypothetical protein ACLQVY_14430 [Limisphaerales bacterium]